MDVIAALLTIVLLALPLAGAWLVAARVVGDARVALPVAALAWAWWAVAGAEALPLERWVLGVWWLVPAIAAAVALVRARAQVRDGVRGAVDLHWRGASRVGRSGVVAIAVVGALTLLTALVAAPNNWDSMTYHLARVAVWAQQGEVAQYATHIEPQLYQPPGAELLVLHSYVLAGSDALTALVQWGAWLGCVLLAGAAARALGAGGGGQLGASVLAATVPMAVLQASSTQNDLLLAMWLLLATTIAVRVWAGLGARPQLEALLAAAAIGMAVLTKGTGLLLGLPVGVLLAVAVVRRCGVRRAAVLATAGLVLAALPNAGQWARNVETYDSIVAAEHAGIDNPYRVQEPDPGTLVANLVRNATNHMDLPWRGANERIEQWVVDGLDAVGVDASDPRSTFLDQPFRVGPLGPHEDHMGSLLLLVLGLWAAGSTLWARSRGRTSSGVQAAWLGMLAAQVLLFAWLITWQNWHARLHLPVTVTVAVLVAVRLGARRTTRALAVVCAVSVGLGVGVALLNVTRPIVGEGSILTSSREAVRYEPRPQLRESYAEVVRVVERSGVDAVGLVTGIDDWQYPLLVDFDERGIDVRQVLVTGPSARYAATDVSDIDAVVCVGCTPPQQGQLAEAGLAPVALDNGGARVGRGDDVTTVELWQRGAGDPGE